MSYAPILTEPAREIDTHFPQTKSRTQCSSKLARRPSSRRHISNGKARRKKVSQNYPIIVHCHLCWDWVWQRPQQFISRLSQRHNILFVETAAPDPELAAPLARFRTAPDFPNITILR